MKVIKLGEIAKIDISNVDKKTKGTDSPVVLCNFVDVYHNWAITNDMFPNLMKSTANENQIKRFSIHRGQVAITKDSETRDDIGVSTYIADSVPNGVLGYHCALITPDEKRLVGKFLNVVLHTPYAQKYFEMNASGSGQRYTLSVDTISNFPVPIPDLKIQHVIGDFFSSIDMKLATNNRICFELESMVKTIYDYWFTQFDFPNKNGKPYRSSGGAMVWNEQLKRSIPQKWALGLVSDCVEKISTGLNPRDNFVLGNGNIRYITVKNLTTSGSLDFSGCDVIDEEARAIVHRRSDISVGDILFASIAPLGRCFLIQQEPIDWDINESVFSIRSKKDTITPEFLYLYFQSDSFIQKATNTSTGSIFKGIRINTLLDTAMIIPDLQVCKSFTSAIKPLLAEINNNSSETVRLIALRDWLLPMLMNGQVSLKDKQEEKPQIKVSGFEQWIANQGYAARGDVDIDVLRDIYEAMDEDDQ